MRMKLFVYLRSSEYIVPYATLKFKMWWLEVEQHQRPILIAEENVLGLGQKVKIGANNSINIYKLTNKIVYINIHWKYNKKSHTNMVKKKFSTFFFWLEELLFL